MARTSPQGSAASRSASDRPPLRLIHGSAPAGCIAETTSTIDTPFGTVTVRVRRFHSCHLTDLRTGARTEGFALEVAVRTPRTSAEGTGFVEVGILERGCSDDDLAAHIEIGAAVERVAAARASDEHPEGIPPIWPAAEAAIRPLRRVKPAKTTREARRRLLHVRCNALVKHAMPCDPEGVLLSADDVRHQAAEAASGGRTTSSRRLSDDELDDAITGVEDQLYRADYDFDAADEAYRARCAAREAMGVTTSTTRAAA